MYYDNLNNSELQLFHQIITARDMSVSLTEILSSDLFKKIRFDNNIVKIFPLFYAEKIETDSTIAKVLDNKCIITSITEREQYFHFVSDESDIVMFEEGLAYALGHELTLSEYNGFVQLLRACVPFEDNIKIKDNVTHGTYADYRFNLADVTIVDNGILITEETLTANPTVRLLNPLFKNSSYTLKLDVFSISDVNVLSDNSRDNITHETLTVPLTLDTDVELDLGELDFNRIISFNASVEINHDKPIIVYTKHLDLSVEGIYRVGETLTLTATYDEAGTPLQGKTIKFYDGETQIGTSQTTDNNGVATLTYQPSENKDYRFKAVCTNDEITSNTLVKNIVKQETSITLNTDTNLVYLKYNDINCNFKISGTLTKENEAFNGADVKIYNNGTLLDTLTTSGEGEFKKTIYANNQIGTYNLQAVYEGTNTIDECKSNFINVVVRKIKTNITATVDKTNINPGDTVTITGKLTDEFGNGISGAEIRYDSSNRIVTTNSNGEYTIPITISSDGSYKYDMWWNLYQNGAYKGYEYERPTTKSITVKSTKLNTNIVISANQTVAETGADVVITANVTSDNSFNPPSIVATIDGTDMTVTNKDNNGNFIFTLPTLTDSGTHTVTARYDGTNRYNSSSSNTVTVKYKIPTRLISTTQVVSGVCFYMASLQDYRDNSIIAGKTIKLVTNDGDTRSITTSETTWTSTGFNKAYSPYTWSFDGDDDYFGAIASG